MDDRVEGSRDPLVVGDAMGTERPQNQLPPAERVV